MECLNRGGLRLEVSMEEQPLTEPVTPIIPLERPTIILPADIKHTTTVTSITPSTATCSREVRSSEDWKLKSERKKPSIWCTSTGLHSSIVGLIASFLSFTDYITFLQTGAQCNGYHLCACHDGRRSFHEIAKIISKYKLRSLTLSVQPCDSRNLERFEDIWTQIHTLLLPSSVNCPYFTNLLSLTVDGQCDTMDISKLTRLQQLDVGELIADSPLPESLRSLRVREALRTSNEFMANLSSLTSLSHISLNHKPVKHTSRLNYPPPSAHRVVGPHTYHHLYHRHLWRSTVSTAPNSNSQEQGQLDGRLTLAALLSCPALTSLDVGNWGAVPIPNNTCQVECDRVATLKEFTALSVYSQLTSLVVRCRPWPRGLTEVITQNFPSLQSLAINSGIDCFLHVSVDV
jgi:hypothetical protein